MAQALLPPIHLHGVTYMQQLTCCGKRQCGTCGGRRRVHGPYWFAFYSRPRERTVTGTGRTATITLSGGGTGHKYIGRELPPAILEAFREAATSPDFVVAETKRVRRAKRRA